MLSAVTQPVYSLVRGSDRPNTFLKKYPFASVSALALLLPSGMPSLSLEVVA